MKKTRIMVLIVAIVLACIVLTTRNAGGDRRPPGREQIEEIKGDRGEKTNEDRRNPRHARIFHGLNLTEDQRQQIGEITRQFREDMKALHIAHKENMMSVLTPGQQDTLRMRMERIKGYRENNRPGEREEDPREDWPDHWRGDFPDRINTDEDGAAKSTENNPVALQDDQTTWGKIKILFQ